MTNLTIMHLPLQKSKNISEHENPLKNKFEHHFEAKFGRHQSFKSF
jgi:hypothetical protein